MRKTLIAAALAVIRDGMHAKNWDRMRRMRSESFKLRRLWHDGE